MRVVIVSGDTITKNTIQKIGRRDTIARQLVETMIEILVTFDQALRRLSRTTMTSSLPVLIRLLLEKIYINISYKPKYCQRSKRMAIMITVI